MNGQIILIQAYLRKFHPGENVSLRIDGKPAGFYFWFSESESHEKLPVTKIIDSFIKGGFSSLSNVNISTKGISKY
jgi:hypothetical protein